MHFAKPMLIMSNFLGYLTLAITLMSSQSSGPSGAASIGGLVLVIILGLLSFVFGLISTYTLDDFTYKKYRRWLAGPLIGGMVSALAFGKLITDEQIKNGVSEEAATGYIWAFLYAIVLVITGAIVRYKKSASQKKAIAAKNTQQTKIIANIFVSNEKMVLLVKRADVFCIRLVRRNMQSNSVSQFDYVVHSGNFVNTLSSLGVPNPEDPALVEKLVTLGLLEQENKATAE